MKTDEEIRRLAGHPDCIPQVYIEWFYRGWKACEADMINSGMQAQSTCVTVNTDVHCAQAGGSNCIPPPIILDIIGI